jgi:DNA-binding NarL/FixJ family response regulator
MNKENNSALLTKRELQIIRMISKGLKSKEIAQQMGISSRTVETHRFNILRKTGSKNAITAIRKVLSD